MSGPTLVALAGESSVDALFQWVSRSVSKLAVGEKARVLATIEEYGESSVSMPVSLGAENPNRLVSLWDIMRDFDLLGLLSALKHD